MAVLLSILKIIGIVLLIILLVFLAVTACILFIPVQYQACGHIEEKKYRVRLSWLFRLVQFRARYEAEEELSYGIYILGRRTGILDPEKREKRKRKKEKKQAKKSKKERVKFQKKREEQKAKISLDQESETEQNVPEKAVVKHQSGSAEARASKNSLQSGGKSVFKPDEEETGKTFLTVWKTCRKVLNILKDIRDKNLLGLLLPKVKRLFYHLRPRKLKAELTFGFSDPSVTGRVLGGISWLFFLYQYKEFVLIPDFETDDTYIKGTFCAEGHIRCIHLLIFAIGILREKEFRKFIKSLKLN